MKPSSLPAELRREIAAARDELKTALDAFTTTAEMLTRLEAKRDELAESLEKLTAAIDPLDDAAVALLSAQERQAQLVAVKIEEVQNDMARLEGSLFKMLPGIVGLVARALDGEHETLVSRIANALEPWMDNEIRARNLAVQADAVFVARNNIGGIWAEHPDVNTARVALQKLDALLRGESPFPAYRGAVR